METASYNGSNWVWLTNWVNHNSYQLRELTWDQHLFNDDLLILVGRSNPRGAEFDGSSLYCTFATASCGIPGLFAAAGSLPTFETSSWSGRVTVKPTPATYIKAGVWEDEPSLRNRTDNVWPGRDWGRNQSACAFIPVEAGMRTTFANDAMPR